MKPLRTLVVDDANGSGTLDALRLDRGIDVVASLGFEGLVDEVRAKQPAVLVLIPRSQSQALSVIEQVMAKHPVPILVLGDDSLSRERVLGAGALWLMARPAGDPLLEDALRKAVRLIAGVAVIRHVRGRGEPAAPSELTVVGIAASTGGPPAVAQVLKGLEGFSGSVLVVQHIHSGFMGGFVEWMQRESALPTELARDGAGLRPGHVYLAPPAMHLKLGANRRLVLDTEPLLLHRPSADILFRSIAEQVGPAGIGVLLTGMGDDGAQGLLAMRSAGGRTVAQDETSSAVFGMPHAADHLGAAQRMLPLERIAAAIMTAAAVGV